MSNTYSISVSSDIKWFARAFCQLNLVHSVDWYWFWPKQLALHFSKPRLHKFTTTPLSWQTRSHTIHLHSQPACLLWSFSPRHEAVIWFILLYYCFLCPSPCLCLGTHDESTARGQHTAKVRIWRHDEVKMWLQFQNLPRKKVPITTNCMLQFRQLIWTKSEKSTRNFKQSIEIKSLCACKKMSWNEREKRKTEVLLHKLIKASQ